MEERVDEVFRQAISRSLADRPVARVARAYGLPKDAIRHVLHGHAPRLARADAICRAVGFEFLLGGSEVEQGEHTEAEPQSGAGEAAQPVSATHRVPVRDVQLAEMLARLVDRWEVTPVRERAGFLLAITSLLDLAGARGAPSLGRTIESLAYREVDEVDSGGPSGSRI